MGNMSYCRFENTYCDLLDCIWALENGEEMSQNEMSYARKMRKLCELFVEAFDNYTPQNEDEDEDSGEWYDDWDNE